MHTNTNHEGAAKLRSTNARWRSSLLAAAVALTGCGEGALNEAVADSQQAAPTWEEFLASAYREPGTGVLVANGDETFQSLAELRAYYDETTQQQGKAQGALTVGKVNGVRNIWSATQKLNLTYCVDSSSLGANYTKAVQALNSAAGEWEAAGNVNFIHRSEFDGACTLAQTAAGNVVFIVNQVSTGETVCKTNPQDCDIDSIPSNDDTGYMPAYYARSFFPDTPPSNRQLRIDWVSFDSRWMVRGQTLVGLMRHEFGHILGFRHEQIARPGVTGDCAEGTTAAMYEVLNGGAYDTNSVMHYVSCGGTAGYGRFLTELDIRGVAEVYGVGTEDAGTRAIRLKWQSMGTNGGWLGAPTGDVFAAANGGKGRHYQGGSIYWHPNVGAWSIGGAIRQKWADMGWEWSAAGYPTTDENDSCFGTRFNHFQNGTISWHPTDGTFFVFGGIHAKWMSLGGSCGAVGYPIGEEVGSPVYRNFNRGRIYWTANGAIAVSGVTYAQWKLRYQSMLGRPVADTQYGADGFEQSFFERGTLFYTRQWGFEYELY